MPSATPHARYELEEYLRLEDLANVKHEFLEGQIYALAGGTPEHGAIAMRIGAALIEQLRGRTCNVYSSDVRVRVAATGLDTYPDLSVVSGGEERDSLDPIALANPLLLVEILSPSSEAYDRGEKLEHYKQIPSLREVLLVAPDQIRFELWRRESGAWSLETSGAGEIAYLASLECRLDVDEVFRDPLVG